MALLVSSRYLIQRVFGAGPVAPPLVVSVGAGLLEGTERADAESQLGFRLDRVRQKVASEFGVNVPEIALRRARRFGPGKYSIRIHDRLVAEGHVLVDKLLVHGNEDAIAAVDGIHALEPLRNTHCVWVAPASADSLDPRLDVVRPQDVVASHVADVMRQRLGELIGLSDVSALLERERSRRSSPAA